MSSCPATAARGISMLTVAPLLPTGQGRHFAAAHAPLVHGSISRATASSIVPNWLAIQQRRLPHAPTGQAAGPTILKSARPVRLGVCTPLFLKGPTQFLAAAAIGLGEFGDGTPHTLSKQHL
jgi:hypothetical protein